MACLPVPSAGLAWLLTRKGEWSASLARPRTSPEPNTGKARKVNNYHRWTAPSGSGTTSPSAELAPQIGRYLRKHPGATYDQISDGIGKPRSTVTGHMREASNSGTLVLEVDDQSRPYHFRMARLSSTTREPQLRPGLLFHALATTDVPLPCVVTISPRSCAARK